MRNHNVADIRDEFVALYRALVSGAPVEVDGTLELVGSSFLADQPLIFGAVNQEYVKRELEWYESQSLAVRDIPGGPPKIWRDISSINGEINSNYGWAIWSAENGQQFNNVVNTLRHEPDGRRATMVYSRPSMHTDWNRDGMRDFMCTNAVNYYRRDSQLHAVVQMRSNDAVFGYRNDHAWQAFVLDQLCEELLIEPGTITWQAGSLHVYRRHYYLIDRFMNTGEYNTALKIGK